MNNLISHGTVGGTVSKNNFNFGGANFGLGAINNLGNFGGYLGKGASNTVSNNNNSNMSAYAMAGSNTTAGLAGNSTASELLRGFKSSQSIPLMTNSQQASVH